MANIKKKMLIVLLIDIYELGSICPTQAGKCPDDKICGTPTTAATADDCETKLIADPACLHYTFDVDDADGDGNKCSFYSECATPDASACPNCVSGPKSCGGGKMVFCLCLKLIFYVAFLFYQTTSSASKIPFDTLFCG
jgi:hypothetical protein